MMAARGRCLATGSIIHHPPRLVVKCNGKLNATKLSYLVRTTVTPVTPPPSSKGRPAVSSSIINIFTRPPPSSIIFRHPQSSVTPVAPVSPPVASKVFLFSISFKLVTVWTYDLCVSSRRPLMRRPLRTKALYLHPAACMHTFCAMTEMHLFYFVVVFFSSQNPSYPSNVTDITFPDLLRSWLDTCPRARASSVSFMNFQITEWPQGMLAGMTSLTSLMIQQLNNLKEIPRNALFGRPLFLNEPILC